MKRSMFRRIGGKRGFTLIELLIVMSIIAVLVAVVALSLTGFLGAGKEQVCQADKRSLQSAALAFYSQTETGTWPTADGAAGDIDYGALDKNGGAFSPTYVVETPKSDADCDWEVDANGLVRKGAQATANCACE